jgi:phosphohistidine phosphatase
MKTIVLVRHAKSSWDHDVDDLNRPLSKRGLADASLLSKAFISYNFYPDAIFSSPAKRALTTCSIFIENLSLSKERLSIEEQLYDFGGNQVLQFIKALNSDIDKVMIFGHNHAFTALANSLGDKAIDNLPTSGLVMIHFEVDTWKAVSKGTTKMILRPRDFK